VTKTNHPPTKIAHQGVGRLPTITSPAAEWLAIIPIK